MQANLRIFVAREPIILTVFGAEPAADVGVVHRFDHNVLNAQYDSNHQIRSFHETTHCFCVIDGSEVTNLNLCTSPKYQYSLVVTVP